MKWISVKERLPELHPVHGSEAVAIWIECPGYQYWAAGWMNHAGVWVGDDDKLVELVPGTNVTHWMRIAPPRPTDHRAESKREGREL